MLKASKILFIMHLPPPIHGAGKVGLMLKESEIIGGSFNSKYVNLSLSHSLSEIGKNHIVKISRYFLILYKCLYNLLFFRPDVCYFTLSTKGFGFYKDVPLIFLVKLFKVKLLYHLHNKGVSDKSNKMLDDCLYRLVFNHSFVILLSKNLYADVDKYVQVNQVYYCPNGVPKPDIKNANRTKDAVIFNILFLSNLIESKGVYILLEACKQLKERKINFNCLYVGGIGDISEIDFNNKVKELNLINHVRYLGKRFGVEKDEIFNNADILVLPTLNDCFPLVLLEAMQFYLPVISTFEGGIPDIVQDKKTGYLVLKNDVFDLTNKIESLINDPELMNSMGIAAHRRFKENYTLEMFEIKMKAILNDVLSQ
jgi:glycosyltransferase involved in cell wall biosynthesis